MLEQTRMSLLRRVHDAQREWRAPAIAVRVLREGESVLDVCLGDASGDGGGLPPEPASTQFRIGSITKTFTAVLVMRAWERGELDLDAPISLVLPELNGTTLTARALLSHGSGLQREPVGDIWWTLAMPGDVTSLLAGLDQATQVLKPWQRWHYSNLGYAVLGEVVARLAGVSWQELLQRDLLTPLGLSHISVAPSEQSARGCFVHPFADTVTIEPDVDCAALSPAAQLWSSVADLARWGDALAAPPAGVLLGSTVDLMCAPVTMYDLNAWTLGWGLGPMLHRRGERIVVGHDGAMPGFLSGLAVRRSERVVAAVLVNTGCEADPGGLAVDLALALVDAEPAIAAPWAVGPPVPGDLEELLGTWWSEGSAFSFEWRGGQFTARAAQAPAERAPAVFDPVAPDRWTTVSGREQGEELRVVRRPDGQVLRLHWATYAFTREPRGFAPGEPG